MCVVQLLSILPSQSNYLIPFNYRKIMTKNSDIATYYPVTYELDTFLKRYNWMCPPILPNIDVNKINKCFRKINMDKETKEMFDKNELVHLNN